QRLLAERERKLADLGARFADADVEAAVAALAPTVESAFAAAKQEDLRELLDLLRIEVRVIDRETVRLVGVIGTQTVPLCRPRSSGSSSTKPATCATRSSASAMP